MELIKSTKVCSYTVNKVTEQSVEVRFARKATEEVVATINWDVGLDHTVGDPYVDFRGTCYREPSYYFLTPEAAEAFVLELLAGEVVEERMVPDAK